MHLMTGDIRPLSEAQIELMKAIESEIPAGMDTGRSMEIMHEQYQRLAGTIEGHPYATLTDDEVRKLTPMSKPKRKNWMRNQLCPCKSGRKFKVCCWGQWS